MKNKKYVVRVVQTFLTPKGEAVNEGGYINNGFLDCLRYAGIITVHDVDPYGLTATCFDIPVENKEMGDMLSQKMRSFGFNAVLAPSTE